MNADEIFNEVLKSHKLKMRLGIPSDMEIDPQSKKTEIDIIRRIVYNNTGSDNLFKAIKLIAGV